MRYLIGLLPARPKSQFAYAAISLAEFVVGLLCSVGDLLFLITVFSHSGRHLMFGKAFALAGCGIGLAV